MSSANQLYLLADHIKLSLLERQRAQSLNLDGATQDGHISRSLDQFRDGLAGLDDEAKRLGAAGDDSAAKAITSALPALQKQLDDLTSQFHGFSSPSTQATLSHPNDPSLQADFTHAATVPAASNSSSSNNNNKPKSTKSVRFRDTSLSRQQQQQQEADIEAQLFPSAYRDDPSGAEATPYRDHASTLDNQQIHAYHEEVLAQQDAQLDALGESIGRQRELSMRIGDELDEHVAMLDDVDAVVDRHQSRLDRARKSLGKVARAAGDNRQMTAIVILIIVLVLLIAVLK